MIRPEADETVVAQRDRRTRAVLAGAALTGALSLVGYAAISRGLAGTMDLTGMGVFAAVFAAINLGAHLTLRRRIDYCLTDRRLLIAPDLDIPLADIDGLEVGLHSVTVKTGADHHRIIALTRPRWLATRMNRCRAQVSPETGLVAT